jgi:hypothetical protein
MNFRKSKCDFKKILPAYKHALYAERINCGRLKSKNMKLCYIFFVILLFGNCTSDQNEVQTPNLKKLEESCMIFTVLNLETVDTSGRKVFLNSDLTASFAESAIRQPFVISGSGCVLDSLHFGTVAHIVPLSFDDMYTLVPKNEQEIFGQKLEEAILKYGLSREKTNWRFIEHRSFVIPPRTMVEPLTKHLEKSPLEVPEGAFLVERQRHNATHDVAVYKFKRKCPGIIGFFLNDLATPEEIKQIKNGSAIESWGYPQNVKGMNAGIIEPIPEKTKFITQTPGPGYERFGTNIQTQSGASGSFVLDIESKKIIGVITDIDHLGTVRLSPASYLREIYEEVLSAPR